MSRMNFIKDAEDSEKERQKENIRSVQPYLRKAYLRLQLRNSLLIPGLLENYTPEYLSEYVAEIFAPPRNPEEAKIQLLADLVIGLMFPEKKIELIISKALSEIKKAYNVILQIGGGWSSPADKSQEKRKSAVLEWYQRNQASLSYLKEIYLDDPALYEDGGGQEKRNFIVRLMIKIVKDQAEQELTFQKVDTHFKNLKKLKPHRPLRLEDL
jgi:hypothetical protein